MPLDLQNLIDKTLHSLGVSHLNVELDPVDIAHSIDDALNLYNKYLPGKSWVSLGVSSTVQRYVLVQRNLIDIMDVQLMKVRTLIEGYDILPDINLRVGEISQWLIGRKDAGRFLSYNATWETQWEVNANSNERELVLYCDIPESDQYLCTYLYAWYREVSDDLAYGLPSVPENDVGWVEDFVLASTKYKLGRILDKFKGVASPAQLGLDGQDLRSEAAEEMAELKASLLSRKPQPPPLVG